MSGQARALHGPTAKMRARARAILQATRAGPGVHRAYLEDAAMLHGLQSELPSIAGVELKLRLEFRPSVLFRRSYLVGWTSARALKALAPDCDAIAVSLSLLPGESVPVVLAPTPRRLDLGEAFRSVLEHEFVHVNQILSGITPPDYRATGSKGIVDAFLRARPRMLRRSV